MIVTNPPTFITSDAKKETDAEIKIHNVFQHSFSTYFLGEDLKINLKTFFIIQGALMNKTLKIVDRTTP